MASKNEYEMLFQLNARMNGGFSGTFSKAQAEFTRLGKEIQSLHKVQGDIASYQKQQSAIEATPLHPHGTSVVRRMPTSLMLCSAGMPKICTSSSSTGWRKPA